jgi:molecular chaperone IbpA
MRNAFDFAPYRRSSIGFDRLFDMMENDAGPGQENYPPFDLIQIDENQYRIDLAVAGFKGEEIDITAHQNVLIVAGKKRDEDQSNFIHRGIATRSFERRFTLADHIKVTSADLKDGLLSVELMREIPEAMKPKKINIGRAAEPGPQHDRVSVEQPASQQTIDADSETSR